MICMGLVYTKSLVGYMHRAKKLEDLISILQFLKLKLFPKKYYFFRVYSGTKLSV